MQRRKLLATSAGAAVLASLSLPARSANTQPIVLGQSAALTGAQASFGIAMRDGLSAAIAGANAKGGVQGRQVKLVSLDDAGSADKTATNLEELALAGCTGFVGATTRPCSEISAKIAAAKGIALVGAFSGTPLLYGDKATTTFPTRASYANEMTAIVRHYAALGAKKFGFIHLEDAKATNVPLLQSIVESAGAKLTVTAGLNRTSQAMTGQVLDTINGNRPDAMVILANNLPLTPVLRSYAPRASGLGIVVISFIDRDLLRKELGQACAGVAFTNVVPETVQHKYSSVRNFHEDIKASGIPAARVTQITLEGYVAGLSVLEGLRAAKGDSRTALIDGMASVALDVGFTRIQFSKAMRSGSRFVDLVVSDGVGIRT